MAQPRAAARARRRHRRRALTRAAAAAVALLCALPAAAAAAPRLEPVGSFDAPVHVTGPPGDPARLFVVEQRGVVRLLVDGRLQAAPFADLSRMTVSGGERGLLSIAFPPDYAASGLFYVFLTAAAGATPGGATGDLTVLEGRRSADPNRADDGFRLVLRIAHPRENHNGGLLMFGPDGLLYVGTGDGGGQGDPDGNAQDGSRLLGKLLRLDPRAGPGGAYTVPADNPAFADRLVWARGLRNPWRFSFDRVTGDLLVGDVGAAAREEIDFVGAAAGAGRGRNFGWDCIEAELPTGECPTPADHTPPVLSLRHEDGYAAVVGGFVVRDPSVPSLLGRYVYGDIAQPTLYSADPATWTVRPEPGLAVTAPASFGEDACGRVYRRRGRRRVPDREAAAAACVPAAGAGAPAPAASRRAAPAPRAADTRPCRIGVRRRRHQGFRRVRLALRTGEACRVTLRARRFRTRTVRLRAGVRRSVALTPTRRGRRLLARHRSWLLTVRLVSRDAVGNLGRRRVHVRLVRQQRRAVARPSSSPHRPSANPSAPHP